MKKLLLLLAVVVVANRLEAQITITANDMPVAGDTLRYSSASPQGGANFNLNDSGINKAWVFDTLTAMSQGVDTYKTAAQINPLYVLTAPAGSYGYKVADSFPLLSTIIPVSINELYTFFKKNTSPNCYEAVAFGATISGIPFASKYAMPDIWYDFPLTYGNSRDSNAYSLPITIPSLGGLSETGYRINYVDGWGTIVTPYFTTPVNCVRVRSEIHETDTLTYNTLKFEIPRHTIEYKWLVNGQHYPALWITETIVGGTANVTSINYLDSVRHGLLSVANTTPTINMIKAYPNPALGGVLHLELPNGWTDFEVEVYDVAGRLVSHTRNKADIDAGALARGQYVAHIVCGQQSGYAVFTN